MISVAASIWHRPDGPLGERKYELNKTYIMQNGEPVVFIGIHNENSNYETMYCDKQVNRYTRRDYGRVTGTPFDYSDPRNVPPQ